MASLLSLAILFSVFVQGTLGGLTCEQLNKEDCAFAISANGKRCVLEKYVRRSGEEAYKCTTSAIEADKLKDLVETNHCIEACGLDRDTLGISSDSLLESRFTQKLCSPECYHRCPNIVDLYFNLAAGEGVFLPKLCEARSKNPRRGMSEIKSSGIAALGPVSGIHATNLLGAPIGSPIESLELATDAPVESPTYLDAPVESPTYFGAPIESPSEALELGVDAPVESPTYPGAPIESPSEALELGLDAPVESPTYPGAPAPSPYY